ncbi:hypothetical protein GIB67_019535 [Kingdonia uniflora]|uniref:Zinc-finger domain-containing protein n=1 Tax=Kingdonia uniflora TaxID=39325 RepID=A0A7J7N088_9MAGN|nr:hypothetical protein GIB67_019535 [Kingdonia uniflora]
MVTLRSSARTLEISKQTKNNENTQPTEESYEQCRIKRIKENMERMEKLGIQSLSFKLKTEFLPRKPTSQRKTPSHSSPLPSSSQPLRRSSRLQNVTPISYSEVRGPRSKDMLEDTIEGLVEEGSKPEIYTEEHEKLLGTCEESWTLFVDGYGTDGKRIYDSVKGKTCHQCRQKTLGYHTHCSTCNLVQGQFCGDCLYMRYGEHVLEVKKNPSWICPPCRGICNCSLCRHAKGWAPTGTLYRKISKLGFKSVAHYLIQTRRALTDSEKEQPVSAKRSLPFEDKEEFYEKKDFLCSDEPGLKKSQSSDSR